MFEKIKNSEFIKVLALMKKRLPLYIISTTINSFIVAVFLNITLAFVMRDAVNAVINGDWDYINRAILIAVVSLIIGIIFTPFTNYLSTYCVEKTLAEIRLTSFKHMEKLTVSSLDKHHSGDVVSRLTTDIDTIQQIYRQHIPQLSFAIIYGLLALCTIFTLDYKIGFIVIIVGIVSILINKLFSNPLRKVADNIQNHKGKLTQSIIDLLEGFVTIKMFRIENIIFNGYETDNNNLVKSEKDEAKIQSLLMMINTFYQNVRYLGLLIIGLVLSIKSSLDIGSIAAIIHLQGNACYFFDNIGRFTSQFKASLAGANRLFEFHKRPIEIDTKEEFLSIDEKNPIIKFNNVSFHYDSNKLILNQINLSLNKGDYAALVGPSGSGKSSILKLLLRFYKYHKGKIILNSNNLCDYSLKQLRQMIAYVPQDAYLFTGTIKENIQYGNKDATFEEIKKAAKMAYADEFIEKLSDGYDTMIGEKGANLSGGQKQRLAIARAFLKNAPILILDEATSALDSDSEKVVQRALDELVKGRTTIAVSHRLSTIKDASIIYVINQGEIVDSGDHIELINKKGLYQQLYKLQYNESI